VAVTGLSASTQYYYKVGSPSGGFSDVYSFLTAPAPTNVSTAKEFSVSVFGDMGQCPFPPPSPDSPLDFRLQALPFW
jgi:hypothetical protein